MARPSTGSGRSGQALGGCLAALLALPLPAQELTFLKGRTLARPGGESTFAWMLEYQQGLDEHRAISLAYLNEGHLPFHHRDGNAVQLWERALLLDDRLALAGGLGTYYSYDTTGGPDEPGYQNRHGFGAIGSLSATWYFRNRLTLQARVNWVNLSRDYDTLTTLLGAGWQLSAPEHPGPRPRPPFQEDWTTGQEIIVHAGSTIVNSFHSELSPATGLEYRRGLARYADLSLTWLYEGRNTVIRRNGLAAELWAVRAFRDGHLAIGAGGGAYLNLDANRRPRLGERPSGGLDGVVSLRLAARLGSHWEVPVTWHRIITGYDRDTDIFMLGLGWRP